MRREHPFGDGLAAPGRPVEAPVGRGGDTLLQHGDFRFAIYPRRGGRAPELDDPAVLRWLGRLLGRIHRVGAVSRFRHRETVGVALLGEASRQTLLEGGWIPDELLPAWRSIADRAIDGARAAFERAGSPALLRLHGDCHAGNLLWTDEGPPFVDLDDARQGPAVQVLWLLRGKRERFGQWAIEQRMRRPAFRAVVEVVEPHAGGVVCRAHQSVPSLPSPSGRLVIRVSSALCAVRSARVRPGCALANSPATRPPQVVPTTMTGCATPSASSTSPSA